MINTKKRESNRDFLLTLELNSSSQDFDDTRTIHNEPLTSQEEEKESYIKVSLTSFLVSFCGFSYGWDVAIIGSLLNMSNFQYRFGQYNVTNDVYEFTDIRTGLISGLYNISAIMGCLFLPMLSDSIGKRKNMVVGNVIYLIGTAVFISANDKWYQVFIARLITGFSIGGLSVLAPSLVSEMAPLKIRGVLLSIYQILTCFGLAFGDIVCYGTNFLHGSLQWRVPLIFSIVWQLLMFGGLISAPESQSYLIQKGETDKALESAQKLYPGKSDEDLQVMLNDLKSKLRNEEGSKIDLKYVLHGKPKILYRILCGVLIQAFQGFTGINYFFYYSTTIFKGVGMSSSFVASIILTSVYAVSSIVSFPIINKFKRKTILLVGSVWIVILLLAFVLLSTLALNPNGGSGSSSVIVGKMVIMCTCFYIFTFSVSWGPLAYVIVNEIIPLKLNKIGVGFAMSANWGCAFLVTFFTPFITNKIGFNYGYVFLGCSFASMFFIMFFIPETKGYTLDQIDHLYENHSIFLKTKKASGPEKIDLPEFKYNNIDEIVNFDEDLTPMNDFVTTGEQGSGDYFDIR